MNYKEYLELLVEDLNIVFKNQPLGASITQREKDHYFRVKVLIFHLHADYLLTEIIKDKFQPSLTLSQNRDLFNLTGHEFVEKLRILCATGDFDEGFLTALRILNTIRNNLSHDLIPSVASERDRIKTLRVDSIIGNEEYIRNLPTLEHLLYGSLTYINILAEYLFKSVKGEELKWIMSVRIPQRPALIPTEDYPVMSVIERTSHPTI